jgi:hypothetical protein
MINKKPVYGVDYKPGQVYFTYTDHSFISVGIAWFQYRSEFLKAKDKVSHCGIVIAEGQGISAQPQGIDYEDLNAIFDNPDKHIFFREPIMLDCWGASKTIEYAKTKIGIKYDFGLFIGFAIVNSTIGKLFTDNFKKKILDIFGSDAKLLCSEYASESLFYGGLSYYSNFKITPYEFVDLIIFKKIKINS